LLSDRGEATGLASALMILDRYEAMARGERLEFFRRLNTELGVDDAALGAAIAGWTPGDVDAARRIHFAAEPRTQALIRALNRAPGATERLVRMRAGLLELLGEAPELSGLDGDFRHLFSSWFNRGFLELRRIDWMTSAAILEKIITYEAVHEITGWDDLRRRVAEPDRRLFAFFHPSMAAEPLIFVEVALTTEIPGAIAAILDPDRQAIGPEEARVAVFYSISNCQTGLRGISFGNFLIKQVVSELARERPQLDSFVTLSPVPGLRRWAESGAESAREIGLTPDATPEDPAALAAYYLTSIRRADGSAHDPVAHFHLSNGAMLYRIHAGADTSPRGMAGSWGVMVNYLYDGATIAENHQAYATDRTIAASPELRRLARSVAAAKKS
ncbi:MAG: decarboxylase, partial [Alphaproteobacteria bacterium]